MMNDKRDLTSRARFEDAGLVVGSDGLARPAWAADDELLRRYYDLEWGMPVRSESGLFERITLEAFQAGISWVIVLRRREAFREVFADFDPDAVAGFGREDVERLLADERIIRNRRKIEATVRNARATVRLRERGGLVDLVWSHSPGRNLRPLGQGDVPASIPESEALAEELKKAGFSFVGPVTCFALMAAVGVVDAHIVGSHRRGSSGVWPE